MCVAVFEPVCGGLDSPGVRAVLPGTDVDYVLIVVEQERRYERGICTFSEQDYDAQVSESLTIGS